MNDWKRAAEQYGDENLLQFAVTCELNGTRFYLTHDDTASDIGENALVFDHDRDAVEAQINSRMMNYAESLVACHTGIRQTAFCDSILERMFDDCGGLGHLNADEFKTAAIRAATDLFPAAMGVK